MIKIGWSSRNVSTDKPVEITGQFYKRISKGIVDPITLTALVMDDGSDSVIFLSGDFVHAIDNIINDIRCAVAKKNAEIKTEKILYSVTHTHDSPRYMLDTIYDLAPTDGVEIASAKEYREFLVESASDAIVEAYENRKLGSYSYGYGYAVVAHSRRSLYFDDYGKRSDGVNNSLIVDGHAKMYGNTNDPMFMGFEGASDASVYLLYTFDEKDNLTGAIVNVPCPSQNSEMMEALSSDYWNETRNLIREKYGNIYILPQCACAGDLAPRTLHIRKAEDRRYKLKYEGKIPEEKRDVPEICTRYDIAERIFTAFDEVYSWAKNEKYSDVKISHTVKDVNLDAWKITEAEYEEAKRGYEAAVAMGFVSTDDKYADYMENTQRSSGISRYKEIMDRYELGADEYVIEMHTIAIGDVAFVSHPFELYIDFQHRIQARSPYTQTFLIELAAYVQEANGVGGSGYVAHERAEAGIGYSANIFSNLVSSTGGNQLVEAALEELENLRK